MAIDELAPGSSHERQGRCARAAEGLPDRTRRFETGGA